MGSTGTHLGVYDTKAMERHGNDWEIGEGRVTVGSAGLPIAAHLRNFRRCHADGRALGAACAWREPPSGDAPCGGRRAARRRDLGASAAEIDALTTDVLRDMIILNTPRYPSREEVQGLYERAM